MPSTVLISRPAISTGRARHDSTGSPSTSTVQVPHSPSSQPCLVPVKARSSRKTSSKVLCGANATSVSSPFKVNLTWAFFLEASNNIRLGLRLRGVLLLAPAVQHDVVNQPRLADVSGD